MELNEDANLDPSQVEDLRGQRGGGGAEADTASSARLDETRSRQNANLAVEWCNRLLRADDQR